MIVRCLVEKKGDQWQAFSLEFGLAVQADTLADAKKKILAMTHTYIFDALFGEDQAHAGELMTRKAHWRVYLRYYFAIVAHALRRSMEEVQLFREPMSLEPKHCS